MMLQHRLRLSIVVAQYSVAWLKYRLGATQGPVFHDQLEEDDLLHLYRIGTYHVQIPEEMYTLATLLTALTIHAWDRGDRGSKTLPLRVGKGRSRGPRRDIAHTHKRPRPLLQGKNFPPCVEDESQPF